MKKLSSSGLTPLISSALVKNDSDFDITDASMRETMALGGQTTCCENKKVGACVFIIAQHSPHRKNQKRSTEKEKMNSIFHMPGLLTAGALRTAKDQHAISALMPNVF